ncbi:MAG: class I SAM-dependent methyltransferase [Myxococcota bacterium]
MIDPRFGDPLDRQALTLASGDAESGTLDGGGHLYPVVGGIPFLVPDPMGFVAAHRDAILAWLVEAGAATSAAVEVIREFAEGARGAEAATFSDDWTADEAGQLSGTFGEGVSASWGSQLRDLLGTLGDPRDPIVEAVGDAWRIVEVGPGAGVLAERFADRELLLVDRSPRALSTAARRAPKATLAVMEAEFLALAPESIDAVVAANVVDLLSDPLGFLERAADALMPKGRLVLTTPDPWPWDENRDAAEELMGHLGLRLVEFRDGLAWPRAHGPRQLQLYMTQLVVAEK